MIIDGKTYRFKKQGEKLPEFAHGNESYNEYIERFDGGSLYISGKIGFGEKVHLFRASFIKLNGENVIVSANSTCGSQSYKSGAFALEDRVAVTCKKCGA